MIVFHEHHHGGKQTKVYDGVILARVKPLKKGGKRKHRVRIDRSREHRSKHINWEKDDITAGLGAFAMCAECGFGTRKGEEWCEPCLNVWREEEDRAYWRWAKHYY